MTSGNGDATGATAGAHYSSLITDQLEYEQAAKQSLEQRGVAVITTAGTLVAVLLSLGALVTSSKEFEPPLVAEALVIVALLLFIAACAAAVATNRVRAYEVPDIDALSRLLDERFQAGSSAVGERRVADLRLTMLKTVRRQNERKATALQWALRLQVGAVTSLAVSIVVIVATA